MLPEGGHRRRLPGGEPRPDGDPAAPQARRTSTTSWSRSRSSARARSWGTWSIPTCGGGRAREPVVYAHPNLEPILRRTLGVPLFQEQLLRMAMAAANFTGGEAEDLRRAMGMKRSQKTHGGAGGEAARGAWPRTASWARPRTQIVQSITSFALYGFPESHAASFALLAYASAYLRAHHPAAFVCALLNNQPMGFYSPVHAGQGRAAARRALPARGRDAQRVAVHARRGRGAPGAALRARPAPGGGESIVAARAGVALRRPCRTWWTARTSIATSCRGWRRRAPRTPSASRGGARSGRSRRRGGRGASCSARRIEQRKQSSTTHRMATCPLWLRCRYRNACTRTSRPRVSPWGRTRSRCIATVSTRRGA